MSERRMRMDVRIVCRHGWRDCAEPELIAWMSLREANEINPQRGIAIWAGGDQQIIDRRSDEPLITDSRDPRYVPPNRDPSRRLRGRTALKCGTCAMTVPIRNEKIDQVGLKLVDAGVSLIDLADLRGILGTVS